jgi:signal transduction histidine kinase
MFRPAVLDDFGLEQTLEWFAGQFSRQAGVKVHFEGKLGNGFFPPDDAIHVYRIVQEALSNVARHAKAQEAWVTLREENAELNVQVRDNGAGFETGAEMNRFAGVGLMGMRERAEHLGGSFRIESSPGAGTVVRVRVPLKNTSQDAPARTRDEPKHPVRARTGHDFDKH